MWTKADGGPGWLQGPILDINISFVLLECFLSCSLTKHPCLSMFCIPCINVWVLDTDISLPDRRIIGISATFNSAHLMLAFFFFSVARMILNAELQGPYSPTTLCSYLIPFKNFKFTFSLLHYIYSYVDMIQNFTNTKWCTMKIRFHFTLAPKCLRAIPKVNHHYKFLEYPSRDNSYICKQILCK